MIRQPTSEDVALEWWRSALSGARVPRFEGDPQCGFYARRYVRGGPLVPVRVYLDQEIDPNTGDLTAPEVVRGEENGRAIDPAPIWTHLKPITRGEYFALLNRHESDSRMAATHAPIDITETPTRPT